MMSRVIIYYCVLFVVCVMLTIKFGVVSTVVLEETRLYKGIMSQSIILLPSPQKKARGERTTHSYLCTHEKRELEKLRQ